MTRFASGQGGMAMPDDLSRAGGSAWLDSLLYDAPAGAGTWIDAERSSAGVRPWPTETLGPPLSSAEHRGLRAAGVTDG